MDGQGCIKCSGQWGSAIGIMLPLLFILVAALVSLYRWASKRQALVKRYISTSIIATNHAQTVSCALHGGDSQNTQRAAQSPRKPTACASRCERVCAAARCTSVGRLPA